MLTYSKLFDHHTDYVDYEQTMTSDEKPNVSSCIDTDHTHYNNVKLYTFITDREDIYDKNGQVLGRTVKVPEGSNYVFYTNNTSSTVPASSTVVMGDTIIFNGKNTSQCTIELITGANILSHYKFTVYNVTGDIEYYRR